MAYVKDTPPPTCRLSQAVLLGIHRELRAILKSLQCGVVMHQISVKQSKEDHIILKSTLKKCRSMAKQAIPDILTCSVLFAALLENNPSPKLQWSFYGHFSAYLASIYGHRGGVFQNMKMDEVVGAKWSTNDGAYLINVAEHKTNQAFGVAQISLFEEEYEWGRRFINIKDELPGGADATFFFFTSRPNPCKNLNNYFKEAWKVMGLPGCPTFTDLRTSIATHAKNTHKPEDRQKNRQVHVPRYIHGRQILRHESQHPAGGRAPAAL
ncbi:uncharacterized protein LOC127431957 isoform X1 [Myxocyprinus asiaticus]|uniref:uncharacterized protein LOC127431957 isoform X1 n=1 Tax=Myxocyprinus asiaticus TaxID=70543 RepID=UPI0022215EA9|nr:uncharacterized protein LOC127431957 isoform X1 [Myxocyprinus asiaticus]